MAQILNGTLAQIVEQCKLIMVLNSSGQEIISTTQILNGALADVIGQTKQVMFIASDGQNIQ